MCALVHGERSWCCPAPAPLLNWCCNRTLRSVRNRAATWPRWQTGNGKFCPPDARLVKPPLFGVHPPRASPSRPSPNEGSRPGAIEHSGAWRLTLKRLKPAPNRLQSFAGRRSPGVRGSRRAQSDCGGSFDSGCRNAHVCSSGSRCGWMMICLRACSRFQGRSTLRMDPEAISTPPVPGRPTDFELLSPYHVSLKMINVERRRTCR